MGLRGAASRLLVRARRPSPPLPGSPGTRFTRREPATARLPHLRRPRDGALLRCRCADAFFTAAVLRQTLPLFAESCSQTSFR
ncbi:hypothetical protein LY76DRAFT_658527 [Colletotrichum caudatum]|nr:hypothetical protein LY76DRAFT_658527 [Colletotrichum caudatum]